MQTQTKPPMTATTKQIITVIAVVALTIVLVLLLAFITRKPADDTSVAETAGTYLVTQTTPTAGTPIYPNTSVDVQLRTVLPASQNYEARVLEITVTVNPALYTIEDILPESDLLAVNKSVDATNGKAYLDVALIGNQTIQQRNWLTLKLRAKHTTNTAGAVSFQVIETLNSAATSSTTYNLGISTNLSIAGVATSVATTTTVAATTTTTGSVAGVVCGPIDKDGDKFLDLVDFADFALKYNQTCASDTYTPPAPTASSPAVPVFNYTVGQQITLPVTLKNVGSAGYSAVDLDLNVVNAQVVRFDPVTTGGWNLSIGFCANNATYTANRVCIAMTKDTAFAENEVVGNLVLNLNAAGTVTVDRGSEYAYANGATSLKLTGNVFTFTVGNPVTTTSSAGTTGVDCGPQDANRDSKIDIIDFSVLGTRYRKANCGR